jgi:hypothetical protein
MRSELANAAIDEDLACAIFLVILRGQRVTRQGIWTAFTI